MGKAKAKDQKKLAKAKGKAASSEKTLPTAFANAGRRVNQKSPMKPECRAVVGPEDVGKKQTSGFLTYLKSATQQQDPAVQSAAKAVLESYRQMGSEEKKVAITSFFRAGGKRSGLNSLFQSVVTHTNSETVGEWKGYLTPTKLMKLWEVLGCPEKMQTSTPGLSPKHFANFHLQTSYNKQSGFCRTYLGCRDHV